MPYGILVVLVIILLAVIYLTDLPAYARKRYGEMNPEPAPPPVQVVDVVTVDPNTGTATEVVTTTDATAPAATTTERALGNITAFGLQSEGPLEAFKSQPGRPTIALFYAPWCGYCKKLMPVWAQFAGDTSTRCGAAVDAVKINADENPGLAALHGARGYPTIKFLPHGPSDPSDAVVYEGNRSLEDLVQWRGVMMRRLSGNRGMSSA